MPALCQLGREFAQVRRRSKDISGRGLDYDIYHINDHMKPCRARAQRDGSRGWVTQVLPLGWQQPAYRLTV